MTRLFILTIAATLLTACEKNSVRPIVDHSSKYIALEVGNTWTYQMDSIVYLGRGAEAPDTFRYFVKTEVVSEATADGSTIYTLERATRSDTLQPWKTSLVYTERLVDNRLERVQNGAMEVALSLPITEEYLWDANQYNANDEIDYMYENVHTPMTLTNFTFDSTVTVYQELVDNAVNRTIGHTIYAAHHGLVYQEYENLRNVETNDPVGSTFKLTLLSFEN